MKSTGMYFNSILHARYLSCLFFASFSAFCSADGDSVYRLYLDAVQKEIREENKDVSEFNKKWANVFSDALAQKNLPGREKRIIMSELCAIYYSLNKYDHAMALNEELISITASNPSESLGWMINAAEISYSKACTTQNNNDMLDAKKRFLACLPGVVNKQKFEANEVNYLIKFEKIAEKLAERDLVSELLRVGIDKITDSGKIEAKSIEDQFVRDGLKHFRSRQASFLVESGKSLEAFKLLNLLVESSLDEDEIELAQSVINRYSIDQKESLVDVVNNFSKGLAESRSLGRLRYRLAIQKNAENDPESVVALLSPALGKPPYVLSKDSKLSRELELSLVLMASSLRKMNMNEKAESFMVLLGEYFPNSKHLGDR